MARRLDPQARARKQKILIAVLGVVFLAVMAYQAPTILGMFGGSSPEAAEPVATAPPAPAPLTPGTAGTPTPAQGPATLIDSDVAPEPANGQLLSFDRFESKDPFVQQVGRGGDTPAPSSGANPPAPAQKPPTLTPVAPPEAGTDAPPVRGPLPAVRAATISVNGNLSTVAVSGTFPESDPIFRLVALTRKAAKIGIVGGAYASGSQTITLKKGGKPVTLMNTADGTTYVLRLVDTG
jgi:hypothetical protein